MKLENWGEIDYRQAQQMQLACVDEAIGKHEEKIIICSHPPVVTLGKRTQRKDVQGWQGDIVDTERGGRATYHGPGQIVIYPIINLQCRNKDIGGYLRNLETAVVETLEDCHLQAKGNLLHTGVWVGGKKIASIGVAVRRWITYHGLAFNLYLDPFAFTGISPCGLEEGAMTGLEELLNCKVSRRDIENKLTGRLSALLQGPIGAVVKHTEKTYPDLQSQDRR